MNATIKRQRNPDEPKIIRDGEPVILSEGRIGAIVQFPVLVDEGHGYVEKKFEKFVRAPGTRIMAVRDGKIFFQKEARWEKNNVLDWRLPGGKVVDSFVEYKQYLGKEMLEEIILAAAAKELGEEAGLQSEHFSVFCKKEDGATVEWDLYYVVAEDVSTLEAALEHNEGEDIHDTAWLSFAEIIEKCKTGEISEGRTVAALLEFIKPSFS